MRLQQEISRPFIRGCKFPLFSIITLIISIPQIALISPRPSKFGVLSRLIAHDVVIWTPDQLELMFFALSPEVPSFKITSNAIELTRLTVLLCCLTAWISSKLAQGVDGSASARTTFTVNTIVRLF